MSPPNPDEPNRTRPNHTHDLEVTKNKGQAWTLKILLPNLAWQQT